MRLVIAEDYQDLSRAGAEIMTNVVRSNPTARVILATGNSPLGMYQELQALQQRGEFDASGLRVFQLDAYLGIGPDDERSLYGWLDRVFLSPLAIPEEHVVRLPGDTTDPARVCSEFDAAIAASGGIDLSVLGLGPNGHLGFNEPPSTPDLPTRVIDLAPISLEANARYWGPSAEVPRQALTAGMNVLLAARQTLLIVTGAHKRDILRKTVLGPVTPDVPASYLQTIPNITILTDRAAWPLT